MKLKKYSAFDAISQAQRIAFSPMLFQATLVLLKRGVFALLDSEDSEIGLDVQAISEKTGMSNYATNLLLDVGESGELLYGEKVNGKKYYYLSKIGYFILHDRMTQVNLNFTQDVCYQGLFYLDEAFDKSRPEGLKVFGDWATVYPALSLLPPNVQKSWFEFDHFYSDGAYGAVLPHLFKLNPRLIYDIGGNTGKFSLRCCAYNSEVQITIVDLPEQIALAKAHVQRYGDVAKRINFCEVDLLNPKTPLPADADIWWMSQFLDCFGTDEVVTILSGIREQMHTDAKVCILELFPDRQPFEAGAFCLNMSSLYFSSIANGNSRFYYYEEFLRLVEKAGLVIEKQMDQIGIGHTLLVCRKA